MILPLLLAATQAATSAPQRDWSATLLQDAQALHDDIADNHPGPVDTLNPDFARRNDDGLALVRERAPQIHDYSGYWFALKAYVAAFDDGHMNLSPLPAAPPLAARWPGFLTGFDGRGAQVVVTRADTAPLPLGATLVACDGRTAGHFAGDSIGAFQGRWFLASQRAYAGGSLFVDQGNPYIDRATRCTFTVDGKPRTIALEWQPIAPDALTPRIADTRRRLAPPIAATTLADGTRWYTLSGFSADPASAAARQLPPLIAAMRSDRAALTKAPAIVLDLRGNNGGSSDWSYQIARILWGQAAIDRLTIDADAVEWRASPANLKTMTDSRAEQAATASPEALAWFDKTIAGITATIAAGKPLWRSADDATVKSGEPAPTKLSGLVYFLTDWGCGSACLDAADLWGALGAIQIGQETSADTLYMDIRSDPLPSGLSRVVVPMKVYRGRKRGSNVPLKPVHRYTGDMRDTPALQAWVAGLPERRR